MMTTTRIRRFSIDSPLKMSAHCNDKYDAKNYHKEVNIFI